MKRVIPTPINKSVVVMNETKESKLYVLSTENRIYMLIRSLTFDNQTKWGWKNLLRSMLYADGWHLSFFSAIKSGVEMGDVFELDGISDLVEFLKDREETLIEI